MFVYVLNKNKKPLMPCKPAKARKLLKEGKAKVVRTLPFTVKLLWDCEDNMQEVVAGMDTGSIHIGCAAITNGQVVYQSEIQVRQDIVNKMKQRAMYRRNRRGRKTRYRKARWQNRASIQKEGRLAPSTKSKVDSHLREKQFTESILPISQWKVELVNFDIHKISNISVKGKKYLNGKQKGFYNVKAYVLHRDNYTCQKCKVKKVKLNVHHIVLKSEGGTDFPDNLIVLCKSCHERLHKGMFIIKGNKSKTKHATEMNIIKSQIRKQYGGFEETFGYETKYKREQIFQLSKTHCNDAISICCEYGEIVKIDDAIYYKRHIAKGDYRQTCGNHSEKHIPTGKLFGLRRFDYVLTWKCGGFIKAKRSSGFFNISDLYGKSKEPSVNIKRDCRRIRARSSTLLSLEGAYG